MLEGEAVYPPRMTGPPDEGRRKPQTLLSPERRVKRRRRMYFVGAESSGPTTRAYRFVR